MARPPRRRPPATATPTWPPAPRWAGSLPPPPITTASWASTLTGTVSLGADATFTTAAVAPVVVTGPASAITTTSAQLTGWVDTENQTTTYAFNTA